MSTHDPHEPHRHEVTLGTAMVRGLFGLPSGPPPRPGTEAYSPELRKYIDRAISLDPALSDLILKIAGLAFLEGDESHD